MRKMVDNLFGDIVYDYLWVGTTVLTIYGKTYGISLDIYCDEGSEISVLQRQTFI